MNLSHQIINTGIHHSKPQVPKMTLLTEPMLLDQVHSEPLTLDTRLPRTERDQTLQDEEEDKAVVELANIMTTASNPVSPGSASPQHDQGGLQDFVPPTRPSSTPFPHPDPRNAALRRAPGPAEDLMDVDEPGHCEPPPGTLPGPSQSVGVNLNHLPAEIHECILDHLFGFRISPSSKSSIVRWGTALRHSRRRELSELSLVSGVWRVLIQERLYRHIKLKATIESLRNSFSWFCQNPHLRSYVKHIEVWFPVFQPKYGPLAQSNTNILPTVTADGLTNATYILPGNNCSLEEAFYFVAETFPEVTVLTLEGGERKKAPKVRHWIREERGQLRPMPKVETIRTLICKGQWNLIRSLEDWEAIMSALPNLQEWHGSYSKPKSKSYLTMAEVLRQPMSLSTLNLCIEGDYRRELSFPHYFNKVRTKVHFCSTLAQAAALSSMEHISYTGRVCKQFFVDLAYRLKEVRNPRLKSIDITVKNCCRNVTHWNESGSGITDMFFIKAFEALVLAGIRSLEKLTSVQYLRIRYVDLDSPVPPLNPYFQLRSGWASGVWSEVIVSELNRVRPSVRFEELSESFGEIGYSKDGRMVINPDFPRARALSLKLSNYRLLSGGISISQSV